jgi:membrane associated rhomboid family serine protease
MFPLKDENPTEIFPIFTLLLIAANIGVWVWVQGAGMEPGTLLDAVCRYGAIPADMTGQETPLPPGVADPCPGAGLGWTALVTSMFLHGGWLHLIGNVWFLWIFGNNVEDSMGHTRFLVFYLVTGLVAAGAHMVSAPGSQIPMVGASGAISGIMGAYLVLYPRVRVHTLFIIVIIIRVIPLPAWVMLGYWLLIQLLLGTQTTGATGGVAFWAHVGGFLAGVVLVKPFENRQLVAAKRSKTKLRRREIRGGGWW